MPRTTIPFYQIKLGKGKNVPRSDQCQQYINLVKRYVSEMKNKHKSDEEILTAEDRPFLRLKNKAGCFKSAYGQNLLNHVLYANCYKQHGMSVDYLDSHGGREEFEILGSLLDEAGYEWLRYYDDTKEHVYGAIPWA